MSRYHRTTRARSTGLPVTVAHGADLGLDTSVEGGGPWYTVCDEHGTLCSHQTLALARAWAWIEAMDAKVVAESTPTGLLYTVSVPGFHPATAQLLAHAVDALEHNITTFCQSAAAKGPTGARLDRLRAARARWEEARQGD